MLFPNGQAFVAYSHRPMTLHSSTENSLAVLNHKILGANSQIQNVKLGGHQTCCLSINRLWHELCDMLRVLLEPQLLDIMIAQFKNEKLLGAFGNGPNNFEPWSSDETTPELALYSLTTTATGGLLRLASVPYTSGLWQFLARTHNTRDPRIQLPWGLG
ncbi:hypothetical protein TNCV_1835571 [Trichonephila clavipes]|nr:hypothetical protein TNCV_1835571 [Trichonephila clavipes]